VWVDSVPGGASGSELLVAYGPTILVDIGFDSAWTIGNQTVPVAGLTNIRALVDSGACLSCIDSVLAAQLNLPIVDKKTFSGIHGALEVNMHLAQVHVPSLNFTIYGEFAGVHLAAGGQPHKALLGRAFLRNYKMTYDGITGAVIIESNVPAPPVPPPVPPTAPTGPS
jgi:gag-polyprotein putative aspartyl protease